METEFNFTKRALETLPLPEKRKLYRDGKSKNAVSGLQLAITSTGKKTFTFRRKVNGKNIEVRLGDFPNITVENARRLAKETAMQIANGIDPNELKREKRDAITFDELFNTYEAATELEIKKGNRRASSLKGHQTLYRLHIKPKLGQEKPTAFTHTKAKQFLNKIMLDKGYSLHNHVLTLLKSMYNKAELSDNPFTNIKKIDESLHRRKRTLSRDELTRLFESLDEEPDLYRDAVMLLLLTGQRKACVLSMRWDEIKHDEKTWHIPPSKIKSKKEHVVPLTNEAMRILERRSANAKPGEQFVFASDNPSSKTGHIADKSGTGGFWRRIIKRAGLYNEDREKSLRIHDLRRTIATYQVSSGGSLQATSKLLGHSDISITAGTYAHLNIQNVRDELEATTSHMFRIRTEKSRIEHLKELVNELSSNELNEFKEWLEESSHG